MTAMMIYSSLSATDTTSSKNESDETEKKRVQWDEKVVILRGKVRQAIDRMTDAFTASASNRVIRKKKEEEGGPRTDAWKAKRTCPEGKKERQVGDETTSSA
jgi:hypothetical protein